MYGIRMVALAVCMSLMFLTNTWGGEPVLKLTVQPVTIVCIGDSVTGVYYHTGGRRAYPEMLEVAIAQAVPDSQVKVINAGISGNTTTDGLNRLDTDVLAHHPNLVTISFGLNDLVRTPIEQYQANLETLIARCRAAKSEVVLCTPNSVITTDSRPLEKLMQYCDVLRKVGQEQGVAVCDQFAVGEAQKAKDRWAWRLTLSDEIHPNMDGHKRMAEELCRTITGKSVSLADVPPPADPLAKTEALLKAGQPVKVLAMPPYDTVMASVLKNRYPNATIEVIPWPVEGKTLPELEGVANQTVRALKPNLVVIAIPRSVTAESDEQFVHSYSWVMNWSLSFGIMEWDCVVIHPSVADPAGASPRDGLVRQLVGAQDLSLIDRPAASQTPAEEIVGRWVEWHSTTP